MLAAPFMIAAAVVAASGPQPARARPGRPPLEWITLGTKGGPVPNAERSQPANALIVAGKPWIIDCGDGAMERLAAAGFRPTDVDVVFLSHLHMDHIGGLQGLIGLRWMMGAQAPLTIYGPPGTQELVDGLLASLRPSIAIARHEAMKGLDPAQAVKVIVVRDGDKADLGGVHVAAVQNSHFDQPAGQPQQNGSQSLSLRFDESGYAITYTGDTGPSDAVVRLAKGSDILVSEVIDLEQTAANYARRSDLTPDAKAAMLMHLNTQHLSAIEAGRIAARAGVRMLVFTHLSIFGPTSEEAPKLVSAAHQAFSGKIVVAHDLDRF